MAETTPAPTPATDPATPPAAAAAAPAATPPAAAAAAPPETDPTAAGDDQAAVVRIQADRDAFKAKVAELEKKLADAKTLEDIEKAKTDAKAELETTYQAQLLDRSIDVALVQAGCINAKALKALIDTSKLTLEGDSVKGLDTAALAKEYPYLFKATQTVSTGAPVTGAPAPQMETKISGGVAALFDKKGS